MFKLDHTLWQDLILYTLLYNFHTDGELKNIK